MGSYSGPLSLATIGAFDYLHTLAYITKGYTNQKVRLSLAKTSGAFDSTGT